MPWQTLELDRETATSRDVKRAYAQKLKVNRPDQDPEAFRRLHDAYEYALAVTERRERGEPAVQIKPASLPVMLETEAAEVPAPVPEPSFVTAEMTAAFRPLEEALKNDSAEVAVCVRAVEQFLYDHPAQAREWGRLVGGLLRDHGDNRDLSLKPEAMIFELQHESWEATLQIIKRLDRLGRGTGISGLGEVLLENQARIGNVSGAMAAMQLACADAVWCRNHGEALVNFAFPHLTPRQREAVNEEFDRASELGAVLAGLPLDAKLFWLRRLTGAATGSWDDPESQDAIETLRSRPAQRWPGFDILLQHVPLEFRKTIVKLPPPRSEEGRRALQTSQSSAGGDSGQGQGRRRRSGGRTVQYRPTPALRMGGAFPARMQIRLVGLVVGVIIGLVRACGMRNGHY